MYIYHHLGLGDHIICNGLVRHFALNNAVSLYCKHKNLSMVSFMYRDNPNISILPVNSDTDIQQNLQPHTLICGIGIGGRIETDCLWDENFYKNAYVPYEYSWSKFFIQHNEQEEVELFYQLANGDENYAFVHSTGSDGINGIDYSKISNNLSIIEPSNQINLFLYRKIIAQAKEIHCINSAFIHFIDRSNTSGNLFYHKNFNPKPYSDFTLKKSWIII